MTDFAYKPDGETLRQFMRSDKYFRGLRGPVGSGKTSCCCVEIFRRAVEQEKSPIDGIRRTRWAVVRNTGPQLKTTTIKTWLEWFPEDQYGDFKWGVPYTHHIRMGDLDMEVLFLALDNTEDVRKLLSLDLTGVYINEGREIIKDIIDGCTMRCGRYPPMKHGGPTWWGLISDTNAPDDIHWWPIMAGDVPLPEFISREEALMLQRPDDWEFFNQPSGMNELFNAEGEVSGYELNPAAENKKHLVPGYYEKIITGKMRDWIDVYVLNRLGTIASGKPIYTAFNERYHVADGPLTPIPGRTLWVGLDFGFSPAALLAQRSGRGQWLILREIVPDDMHTAAFAREVKAAIQALKQTEWQEAKLYGDPKGDDRSANSEEDLATAYQIFRAQGVAALRASTNDPLKRIETVNLVLERSIDGHPGMLIDPSCKVLVAGFKGGYHYKKLSAVGEIKHHKQPNKNRFSHPHDALQYLLLGAGEGRALIKLHGGLKQSQAKTGWNPFAHRKKRRKSTRTIA